MPLSGRLDSQVAAVLKAAAESGAADLYSLSPKMARICYLQAIRAVAGCAPDVWRVSGRTIPGPGGELALRIYHSSGDARPVLVFFHGGGWSFGGLDSHDHICRWLCVHSGCVVVAVDYRLGPEHKFPTALDDAFAATTWIAENGDAICADASRLAVGGDSAGGNLAAAVALHARDTGSPALGFQMLLYPAVDMTMSSMSHARFGEGYRLTRPLMVWSALNYLRDGRDLCDPRASPLFAADHTRLPPALILTAEFDPLRDEGKRYAEILTKSGTAVAYECEKGMIHGFLGMTGAVERARLVLQRVGLALRNALAGASRLSSNP